MKSKPIVLVHGAWHGGWCYSRVAEILRCKGFDVYALTLTGLGERSHLYTPSINASIHVEDVVKVIEFEQLSEVVLVGHSYGGQVITGVADRLAERVAALVYIDAFVGEDGKSCFDMDLPEFVAAHVDRAQSHGGHTIPPVPASFFGVNEDDQKWVEQMCTPQPFATLAERLTLTGRYASITNLTYIYASGWSPSPFEPIYRSLLSKPNWVFHELPCGHDTMVDMPVETADIILAAASR